VISVVLCAPLVAGLVLPSGRTPTVRARSLSPIACEATVEDAWTTTPSGLKYMDIEVGGGAVPEKGAAVKVHYTGTLDATGVQFDSSKGSSPFAFKLGEGRVIPGWDEGISTMRVGGKRQLLVRARLWRERRRIHTAEFSAALRVRADLD
jgi:peptidylprolyl isomerase